MKKNDFLDKIEFAFCRIDRLDKIDVLATIIDMAERGEEVSSNTIHMKLPITTRHARHWLKSLEELGLLIGTKKPGVKGGLFVYHLSEKAKADADKIKLIIIQRKIFLEKVRKLKNISPKKVL